MSEAQEVFCVVCGREAPERCSSCRLATYCGSDCQVWHWKPGSHKAVCASLGESTNGKSKPRVPRLPSAFTLADDLRWDTTSANTGSSTSKGAVENSIDGVNDAEFQRLKELGDGASATGDHLNAVIHWRDALELVQQPFELLKAEHLPWQPAAVLLGSIASAFLQPDYWLLPDEATRRACDCAFAAHVLDPTDPKALQLLDQGLGAAVFKGVPAGLAGRPAEFWREKGESLQAHAKEAKDRMAGEATIHYPEGRQHCLPDRLWAARNGLITSELLQLWERNDEARSWECIGSVNHAKKDLALYATLTKVLGSDEPGEGGLPGGNNGKWLSLGVEWSHNPFESHSRARVFNMRVRDIGAPQSAGSPLSRQSLQRAEREIENFITEAESHGFKVRTIVADDALLPLTQSPSGDQEHSVERFHSALFIPWSTWQGIQHDLMQGVGSIPEKPSKGAGGYAASSSVARRSGARVSAAMNGGAVAMNGGGSERQSQKCRNCGLENQGAHLRCSRCHDAWYCSVTCQREDWKTHKGGCVAKSRDETQSKSNHIPTAWPNGHAEHHNNHPRHTRHAHSGFQSSQHGHSAAGEVPVACARHQRRTPRSVKPTSSASVPMSKETRDLVNKVKGDNPRRQLEATITFRKLLSQEKPLPYIQTVIDAGILPRFVTFLQAPASDNLKFEAAWVLTNVASGAAEHTQAVVDCGAVPILCSLILAANKDLGSQVMWALGNIAGENSTRQEVTNAGALPLVIAFLSSNNKRQLLRTATWTLSNICRGASENPQTTQTALPVLAKRLIFSRDDEILADVCWALHYLSCSASDDQLQAIVDSGVCPRLAELLLNSASNVQSPTLKVVGNIVAGNDGQTQAIIDANVLPALLGLLSSGVKGLVRDACWALSNVMAGSQEQVQAVIDANIVPPLIKFLKEGSGPRVDAAWAIANAASKGVASQITYLVNQGSLPGLSKCLNIADNALQKEILRGVERVLEATEDTQAIVKIIRDSGEGEIRRLRSDPDPGVSQSCEEILKFLGPVSTS